jgi:hypothetical protein
MMVSGDDVATKLLGALTERRGRRRRLRLEAIWETFRELFPHRRGDPDERGELCRLLDLLSTEGRLTLPKTSSRYDRVRSPPLPLWVEWPKEERPPSPRELAEGRAWHPRLAFVPMTPGLTEPELEAARQIQRFLARAEAEPILTVRERSLRLFGDDKRLEELIKGRLFGLERLDLEILRCREIHLPVVFRDLGEGAWALILENKDTFHSACRAVERLGSEALFRWVVFGAGHAINRSVLSLLDWPERPERLFYFGDLDARGLEIAHQLVATVEPIDLPHVEIAGWLYEALVGSAGAMDLDLRGRRCASTELNGLVSRLPVSIRAAVSELLAQGGRWPQEALTEGELVGLLNPGAGRGSMLYCSS